MEQNLFYRHQKSDPTPEEPELKSNRNLEAQVSKLLTNIYAEALDLLEEENPIQVHEVTHWSSGENQMNINISNTA